MAYRKLSEQMHELDNVQRSDAFLKLFREAVRQGEFEATFLPERFTMPKQFSRRGAEGTYQRETKEMLFEVTPAFEKWFEQTNKDLGVTRRAGNVKPSMEAIESGQLDFRTLAEDTRRRMQASFEKGQALGKSRARTSTGTKAAGGTTRRKKAKQA